MSNEADCMKEERYCDEAESQDCCEPEEIKIPEISSSSPSSCIKGDSKESDFDTLEKDVARIAEYINMMNIGINNLYESVSGHDVINSGKEEQCERPRPQNRIVELSVRIGDIEQILIQINNTRKEINSIF